MPLIGDPEAVVDSAGVPVAVIETTAVRVVRPVDDDTPVVLSRFRVLRLL